VSTTEVISMHDPDQPQEDRWLAEGGHEPAHIARARLVELVRTAGEAQRRDLWNDAVREYGDDEASRIWQDALASSDASET
jgi:hypothetical protein